MQPNDELKPGQFTGFQPSTPTLTDFVASGETGILDTVRNASGDWRSALPTDETQLMKVGTQSYGDTEACTDFSATNVCEIQLDWMIAHGQVPLDALNFLKNNGYIDANGHVNFSDRFTAKMSGTTPQNGNSLPNVWASIRHDGLVPESAWPAPTAEWQAIVDANNFTQQDFWDRYYEPVPANVIAMGKQFLTWFQAQYEWIAYPGAPATMAQLAQYLTVAPLQIATAVCNGWNTDNPINACGPGTQHATTLVNVEQGVAFDIYDHYNPYSKRFAAGYDITYAMRGVLSYLPQNTKPTPPFTYSYETNLAFGAAAGPEVKALQTGLQTLKSVKTGRPYMAAGVFGPFGPQTRTALGAFQIDQGIPDAPQGQDFGPKSRAALTAALATNAAAASGVPLPRPLNWDA